MIVNSMANGNNALAQYTQPQPRAVARAIAPATTTAIKGFDGSRFTAVVLLLATIASGMMLVYSRHQARTLFVADPLHGFASVNRP